MRLGYGEIAVKNQCKNKLTIDDNCGRVKRCIATRKLSEAIILQALDDLWVTKHRESSVDFFTGRDFHVCADTAGLNYYDKIILLDMVCSILKQNSATEPNMPASPDRNLKHKPFLHIYPH
jgi:hypothetical protein